MTTRRDLIGDIIWRVLTALLVTAVAAPVLLALSVLVVVAVAAVCFLITIVLLFCIYAYFVQEEVDL